MCAKIRNFYRRKSRIFNRESKNTAILKLLPCHEQAHEHAHV